MHDQGHYSPRDHYETLRNRDSTAELLVCAHETLIDTFRVHEQKECKFA